MFSDTKFKSQSNHPQTLTHHHPVSFPGFGKLVDFALGTEVVDSEGRALVDEEAVAIWVDDDAVVEVGRVA